MARKRGGAAVVIAITITLAAAGAATAQQPCGGLLQPKCPLPSPSPTPVPTPAPPQVEPATITLRADRKAQVWPKEVNLTGRVSTASGPVGSATIELQARSAEYGRSWRPLLGSTFANGRFTFRVKPGINTRYRVRIDNTSGIGQSSEIEVRYFPSVDLSTRQVGNRLRIGLGADGPRSLWFADGRARLRSGTVNRVHFYAASRRAKTARRIASMRFRDTFIAGSSLRRGTYVEVPYSRLPRGGGTVFACFRGTAFKGMEPPFTSVCGRSRVRMR